MFAPSLADLQSKIGTAANVPASESTEIYLLGTRDALNLKVRNDTLELKRLDQTDENGLELWRPEGKERFPISAESVAKLLAPFRLNFTFQGAIPVEAFLSHVAAAVELQVIDVKKSRRSFSYRGCLAEFTEVTANGRTRQSFCLESEDREVLLAALKDLNLPPKANVNFPRGLKQEFGLSEGPREPGTGGKFEIERKFLVDMSKWRPSEQGTAYRQGYLSSAKERVVRVRIAGNKGFLTIKGPAVGITRSEFEYAIPVDDASFMLEHLCERPIIEKTRFRERVGHTDWEIDVFHGDNEGLVVAEVELASSTEAFDKPDWVTRDVSDDPRYFNNNLIVHPYKTWPSTTQ